MDQLASLPDLVAARYGGTDLALLQRVLTPALLPIKWTDRTVEKRDGTKLWSARFSVALNDESDELLVPGRTGKLISVGFLAGKPWNALAKGRVLRVDLPAKIAICEAYTGEGTKKALVDAIALLADGDLLEVDRYGASAKVLSSLVEAALADKARAEGFSVRRMPEDCAQHVGAYYNYDFEFTKDGVTRKVEVKSLWGTDTRYARLIHSLSGSHETSSCKFSTQDLFAVSRFLGTGNIHDFAFAVSKSDKTCPIGLSVSSFSDEYVNQNPVCQVDNLKWFDTVDGIWAALDAL